MNKEIKMVRFQEHHEQEDIRLGDELEMVDCKKYVVTLIKAHKKTVSIYGVEKTLYENPNSDVGYELLTENHGMSYTLAYK